jgi:hypothetical protein
MPAEAIQADDDSRASDSDERLGISPAGPQLAAGLPGGRRAGCVKRNTKFVFVKVFCLVFSVISLRVVKKFSSSRCVVKTKSNKKL